LVKEQPERQAEQQLPSSFDMQNLQFFTSKLCRGTAPPKKYPTYLTFYKIVIVIVKYFTTIQEDYFVGLEIQ
jgi:hypothetical protein